MRRNWKEFSLRRDRREGSTLHEKEDMQGIARYPVLARLVLYQVGRPLGVDWFRFRHGREGSGTRVARVRKKEIHLQIRSPLPRCSWVQLPSLLYLNQPPTAILFAHLILVNH